MRSGGVPQVPMCTLFVSDFNISLTDSGHTAHERQTCLGGWPSVTPHWRLRGIIFNASFGAGLCTSQQNQSWGQELRGGWWSNWYLVVFISPCKCARCSLDKQHSTGIPKSESSGEGLKAELREKWKTHVGTPALQRALPVQLVFLPGPASWAAALCFGLSIYPQPPNWARLL